MHDYHRQPPCIPPSLLTPNSLHILYGRLHTFKCPVVSIFQKTINYMSSLEYSVIQFVAFWKLFEVYSWSFSLVNKAISLVKGFHFPQKTWHSEPLILSLRHQNICHHWQSCCHSSVGSSSRLWQTMLLFFWIATTKSQWPCWILVLKYLWGRIAEAYWMFE